MKRNCLLLTGLLISISSSFWACTNESGDTIGCQPYTGVVLAPTPCSGNASLIIQVTNKEVNSTFVVGEEIRQNVILGTIEGSDSVATGGLIQFGNQTVHLSDTIYFNFEKIDAGNIVCPAFFSTPSLQAKIISITNQKCSKL